MTVSVIIPTYQRPTLLAETLESVFKQTVLPDEIVIGDDSKDDETERFVNEKIIPSSPVPIRYFHHKPSLREVKNVDFQYQHAQGDLVLHLHDDDPIYPNCIEFLKAPLEKYPHVVASFGLQRVINEEGKLIEDPELVNVHYFRTPERAGLVEGFMAGATSMFPNNAFMVRRDAALSIGYSDGGRAGLATDFYFGFRLGKLRKPFYFVNEFTAKVRLTTASQSRTSEADNAYRAVKILFEDCSRNEIKGEIEKSIRDRIPIAILTAALMKDKKNALRWMFSKYYRHNLVTRRGIKRLFMTLIP